MKALKLVHAKMNTEKYDGLQIIATTYVELAGNLKFDFIFDGFIFTCEVKEDKVYVTGDFIWVPKFEFVLSEKYKTTNMFSVNAVDVIEISLGDYKRKEES